MNPHNAESQDKELVCAGCGHPIGDCRCLVSHIYILPEYDNDIDECRYSTLNRLPPDENFKITPNMLPF